MNDTAKKGLFWRSLEGVGVQGMQFVIQMVLARILMPEDFGVVAILNIFVNLANTLVQNGLSSALIQKKHPDKEDFSTVFIVETGLALLLYGIVFLCAPFIAGYYENPALTPYLRVFVVTIVLSAVGSMQTTVLRLRLDFKPGFIANSIAIVCQGAVGIGMTRAGFGVWSLIVSQIVYRIVLAVLLFAFARWIPRSGFYFDRLKKLFGFSWKLAA